MAQNLAFDEKMLEKLFREHYTGLCRFASGYVKNHETAREIVQEAFVSLWEKRENIDPAKEVKSYLSTAVRNKSLNYLRDHAKFSADLLALENIAENYPFAQPDRLVEKELGEQISRALDELPEKCREVFVLNRYSHLRYQQIADHLGISVKTVETQVSKALRHLRIRLAEYLPLGLLLILVFSALSSMTPFLGAAGMTFRHPSSPQHIFSELIRVMQIFGV